LLPFYSVIIDYARSQYLSIDTIKHLKNTIESLLDDPLLFSAGNNDIKNNLRIVQDEIFRHRKSCLFVPDFFYKYFRDNQEKQMNYSAEYYVNKFLI
jgi:hypothetical protein